MGKKQQDNYPYKTLGTWLKRIRQKKQQSVAEVSGAVEIDIDYLARMESGESRPSEDILMLLISYFGLKDEEAVRVWEMAGYEHPQLQENVTNHSSAKEEIIQPIIVVPMDGRVIYTDMAKVQTNKYGLTINFFQTDSMGGGKPMPVSRLGMSREHAEKLMAILKDSLSPPQQKLLPGPESQKDDVPNSP